MKYALCLLFLGTALAASAPAAKLSLRPSYGGAVMDGRIFVPREDELVGAWSGVGFARLMKCSPKCKVVTSIPLKNTTVMGNETTYRIALGGQFTPGQKVTVTLRLRQQGVMVTQAVVSR